MAKFAALTDQQLRDFLRAVENAPRRSRSPRKADLARIHELRAEMHRRRAA